MFCPPLRINLASPKINDNGFDATNDRQSLRPRVDVYYSSLDRGDRKSSLEKLKIDRRH
jgi:hypothetical protein